MENDQEHFNQPPEVPALDDPSFEDMYAIGGVFQSGTSAGTTSNTSSWSSNNLANYSMNAASWSSEQQVHPGFFLGRGGDADEVGVDYRRVGMTSSIPEQTRQGLPMFEPGPAPANRNPHYSPWQSTPSFPEYPVDNAARTHGDSNFNHYFSMGMAQNYQTLTNPMSNGHWEDWLTGQYDRLSSAASVPTISNTPSQPHDEQSDFQNEKVFRCLWMSGETTCEALIIGERSSVTNHLRYEHDFVCDGDIIECAWHGCTTAAMQRRNIPRHIVACHLEIKVQCLRCGMLLSRADANRKHQLACTGAMMGATE